MPETPSYEVLDKNGNIEIRKYPDTRWAAVFTQVIL